MASSESIVKKIFLFILLLFLVLYIYYLYSLNRSYKLERLDEHIIGPIRTRKENVSESRQEFIYDTSRQSVINGTKNILLWKDSWGYRFGNGRQSFINAGCRVNNCRITTNASFLPINNFDAYLIHPPTQWTRWQLKNRRADQVFVMFSTEPPAHMGNMAHFDNYFNWTMTYLNSSDFPLKYGEIVPLESAPLSIEQLLVMKQSVHSSGLNPARGKSKLAIWLVSNCKAESNRQDYVKVLRKFMAVDIFSQNGSCGGQDLCSRKNNSDYCYDMIEQTYKFYLSFENSICKDYVTEKFFEMMGRNIVPVVLGGADYASIAPRHSYINALDYSHHQLADYLKLLDTNDTLYAEYFWWKPHYRVRNLIDTNKEAFCDLCEALHTQPLKRSTLKNAKKWYISDSNCVNYPKYDQS